MRSHDLDSPWFRPSTVPLLAAFWNGDEDEHTGQESSVAGFGLAWLIFSSTPCNLTSFLRAVASRLTHLQSICTQLGRMLRRAASHFGATGVVALCARLDKPTVISRDSAKSCLHFS